MNSYPLPIPVLGVPIRGKHNPYLVLVSANNIVVVDVDVEESDKPSVNVMGVPQPDWRIRIPLSSFVDVLSDRLEQPLSISIKYRVESISMPPSASLYSILSFEVVRSVAEAGGYEMTSEEIVKAASSIDADAGVDLDYVNAMRTALVVGKAIAYREGEEPIQLDVDVELELVGEEDVGEQFEPTEQVLNAITRLAGIAVVEAIAGLRRGEPFKKIFENSARIDNALYYMLYGLEPPAGRCKWVPSLSAGYGVCLAGEGRGDRLRLH